MGDRQIAAGDFETDPFLYGRMPSVFAGGWVCSQGYEHCWQDDSEVVCRWFIEKCINFTGIVYMHNGGKFDFRFLIPYLPDEVDLFIINGRIASLKFATCELRDSWLIMPAPLRDIGAKKAINITLLEKEVRDKHRSEILEYLQADCVELRNACIEFIDTFGDGLTLAGRAMNEMKKVKIIPHRTKKRKFDDTLRKYYFGGRVQCFESGIIERPLVFIDIKSAYPYAMLSKHWWGYGKTTVKNRSAEGYPFRGEGFYTVIAESRGCLPTHSESGSLCFPNDDQKRIYYASGWEILAGLTTGHVKLYRILEGYEPANTKDFKPFVEKFYQQKCLYERLGNTTKRLFAKLLLNSGYGRFGMNPENFNEYKLLPAGDIADKTEGWVMREMLDECGFWLWERPTPTEDHSYYNVATAASITGYVRAYLWKALCQCTGTVYCDTDSIMCESFACLRIGKELGQWEVEATGDYVAIGGKKLYALRTHNPDPKKQWKMASKGVRMTVDEIIRVAKGEVVEKYLDAPVFGLKLFHANSNKPLEKQFLKRKIKRTA